MKDQDGRKLSGILHEMFRQAAKQLRHCGNPRFLSGQSEAKEAAK